MHKLDAVVVIAGAAAVALFVWHRVRAMRKN